MTEPSGINVSIPPSGPGCAECTKTGGWWYHLRRCAECGHVGCCDASPGQHASAHFRSSGHPLIRSYEPGEHWFYDFRDGQLYEGPALASPETHPADQPVPGPAGRVPLDWESQLHV
ncbi:UBP-type zinc finger domain-containing protein [Rhodococcus sp. X156]|uniref:UBP-type zinc finger domain-containing protein n=1 Tax=Rhodococcus sp. X156 TaxID=2499145 RepID=UPI000FD7955A|nr:UBP-type zinc finger domain-containing protein [Rhodococcus sp. X156]